MKYIANSFAFFWLALVVLLNGLSSCANMATPNGGPYDEDPPKLISSMPALGQTHFTGRKIEVLFDELVQLDKPSENVIITPPQKKLPEIRTTGKRIIVELKDTLLPNMTYTIDFTNSITDNNEKNVLENFSLAFSTGAVIDSLEVAGWVLDAQNLEPMPGILIGLHQNLADSAFTTLPFFRTSKTNDKGQFTIRNVAPGSYRVYALNDVNRDYLFDQPGEAIAFNDSLVVPTFEYATRQDTLWKDSVTIDTIQTRPYTRFLPNDLVLRLFKEDFERQYMLRPERLQQHLFALRFNAPLQTLPNVELLDLPAHGNNWFLTQISDSRTEVNYWITDSLVWQADTLALQISYLKTDSLRQLQTQTDTMRLSVRKQRAKPKKRKKDEPEPVVFLGIESSLSNPMNVYDTLSFVFSEPVHGLLADVVHLEQRRDTVWVPAPYTFVLDSLNPLRFYVERAWKYEEEYRIRIDSAAVYSHYNRWNDWFETVFKYKAKAEYGHFYLNIEGLTTPAFVELLNSSDAPVRQAKVKNGGVLFLNLKPDKYYVRLVADCNENNRWDTGNYSSKTQPEDVYYAPRVYEMRANWEIEETWNIHSEAPMKQKPLDITKNKPKDATKKKRNYKDEGKSTGNRSGGTSGLGF